MQPMTARERIGNLLKRKPVDRASFHESLWGETVKRWTGEGHLKEKKNVAMQLKMELLSAGWFNSEARLGNEDNIVEEDKDTKLVRNGNGALLRYWKNKSGTPEHVDFLVKDRAGWDEHIAPYLKPDRKRVDFENYRKVKKFAAEQSKFFSWSGVNVFEQMHPVCGHEYMLMGMALDPEWIKTMARTFTDLTIAMWEMLFAEEGLPDGILFYEDMGFKEKPFMSPAMYRELIMPSHKRTCSWAHQHGLRVIMHSCGFVEPLVPHMIEAGIDMLQAMEVKAGMNMLRLNKLFGDKIGFMGNIDIREIISNDRNRIDAELKKKILPLMETKTPYILSSDHSTPPDVDYETFLYFRDRGLELARYA
ncbi:MAG: uroporphyrinogen decarboxylase family protein [Kiritimatiellae bacterium]|nr:uroporphyrinogen decarboxylase family protein [Kiritimatiellia bacterium]